MRTPSYRPCWVEVRLDALLRNLMAVRALLSPGTSLLAVVKANAYGHGLEPVSRALAGAGISSFGVSSVEEGLVLREAGIRKPILILGSLYPFDCAPLLFDKKLTPTVASLEAARVLNRSAIVRRKRLAVHVKIDTGFGRIGVSGAHASHFLEQLASNKGLEIQGLYTHFSSSDRDPAFMEQQRQTFNQVVQTAQALGLAPPAIHMANSAALLRDPRTHGTLVRPGLALYGIEPYAQARQRLPLDPVLSWKTRVVYVKQVPAGTSISYGRTWTAAHRARIATLAVGYADGYPRHLSNQGVVLVSGRRVPVVGRVTMDMMMVDVTNLPACRVGDEAVLIGRQGSEVLDVAEVAERAQTNPYEIVSRIAARVPCFYLGRTG